MLTIRIASLIRIASVTRDREGFLDLLWKIIGCLLRIYLCVLVGVFTVHQMMNYHKGIGTLFHKGGQFCVYPIFVKAEAVEWHLLSTKKKKKKKKSCLECRQLYRRFS